MFPDNNKSDKQHGKLDKLNRMLGPLLLFLFRINKRTKEDRTLLCICGLSDMDVRHALRMLPLCLTDITKALLLMLSSMLVLHMMTMLLMCSTIKALVLLHLLLYISRV